jgi:hypothetical protein
MKKLLLFAFVIVAASASVAIAQETSPQLARNEVKKLDGMVGLWKGSGWIQTGPTREAFTGTEHVQRKLDGLALLVEGKFATAEGQVIHETLAVLDYDVKASKFRFATYLATGITGNFDFRVGADAYEWGFKTPAGFVRYQIKTTSETWSEVGEFSKDGEKWMKFFEMNLKKVK